MQPRRSAHSCARKPERRPSDRSPSFPALFYRLSVTEIVSPVRSRIKTYVPRRDTNARVIFCPPPMLSSFAALCRTPAFGSSGVEQKTIPQIPVLRVVIFFPQAPHTALAQSWGAPPRFETTRALPGPRCPPLSV